LDQDDKLNLDEFFGFCDELCVGITPEQVQALLEKYDNDESGNIGFAEFSKAMLGR